MVLIREAETHKVICTNALACSSYWSKARGLILSRRKNLLFIFLKPVFARLHMVFVLYPIWVIGLDARRRVVATARLFPFQFWKSPKPVKYILELSKTPYTVPKIGARLEFKAPPSFK